MEMVKLISVCILFLCAEAQERKLPDFIKTCRLDNDISDCWRKAIEELRPRLVRGIPEIELPSIDPLFIPVLTARRRHSNIADYTANLTDNLWIGVRHFEIQENSVDPDALIFVLKLNFPNLHLHAHAKIDGTILGFPLNESTGRAEVDFANVTVDIVLNGEKFQKNGKEHIRWKKEDMKIYYGDVYFQMHDLLEEPDLTSFNDAMNSNIPLLVVTIRSIVEHSIGSFVIAVLNRAHDVYSNEVLYPTL